MGEIKPNVLIIDDDAQMLEIMTKYLSGVAEVVTAISGKQAIDYVRKNAVDVIFLDINMPSMNGYEVLEQFRKMKECINVPVVFITSRNDKDTILNSASMGSDGILIKPITKETMLNKVKELYQKNQLKKNRKTILAVDDDVTYLKTIDSYLREIYNVVIINSAKLAVDYLMKYSPDLVLMDYQMPLYNGANLMQIMNKQNPDNPIPTIVVSGALDEDAVKECYSCGPKAYLAKPVTKDTLLETINHALG